MHCNVRGGRRGTTLPFPVSDSPLIRVASPRSVPDSLELCGNGRSLLGNWMEGGRGNFWHIAVAYDRDGVLTSLSLLIGRDAHSTLDHHVSFVFRLSDNGHARSGEAVVSFRCHRLRREESSWFGLGLMFCI